MQSMPWLLRFWQALWACPSRKPTSRARKSFRLLTMTSLTTICAWSKLPERREAACEASERACSAAWKAPTWTAHWPAPEPPFASAAGLSTLAA